MRRSSTPKGSFYVPIDANGQAGVAFRSKGRALYGNPQYLVKLTFRKGKPVPKGMAPLSDRRFAANRADPVPVELQPPTMPRKIRAEDIPSSMEQLAASWKGKR